jgi:hypothetical protein
MTENQTATRNGERGFGEVKAKSTQWWSQATKPLIPGLGHIPFPDQLLDLVDKCFDTAGQILDFQRDFTKAVLAMLGPSEGNAGPSTQAKTSAS